MCESTRVAAYVDAFVSFSFAYERSTIQDHVVVVDETNGDGDSGFCACGRLPCKLCEPERIRSTIVQNWRLLAETIFPTELRARRSVGELPIGCCIADREARAAAS